MSSKKAVKVNNVVNNAVSIFSGADVLAHSFALLVPSTLGTENITADAHSGYVDYVADRMSDIFGAVNVSFGYGQWEGIKENNALVTSFVAQPTQDQMYDFKALTATMQTVLQQQCMAVIIDGQMLIWSR